MQSSLLIVVSNLVAPHMPSMFVWLVAGADFFLKEKYCDWLLLAGLF
jgi:hypothetical protein